MSLSSSKTGRRRRRSVAPWLCGEESTAILASGSPRKSKMRMADVLREPVESCSCSGKEGQSRGKKETSSVEKAPPLSTGEEQGLGRWVRSWRGKGLGEGKKVRKGEVVCDSPSSGSTTGSVTKDVEGGISLPRGAEVAATGEEEQKASRSQDSQCASTKKHEDASFNLGIGAGLIFLFAKSASEFNKMTKLKTEIEMLLKEIREVMSRRVVCSSEAMNDIAVSCSESSETRNTSNYISIKNNQPSDGALGRLFSMECKDDDPNSYTNMDDCRPQMMEELEAELESELERLQLSLGDEELENSGHGVQIFAKNTDNSTSGSLDSGEAEQYPNDENEELKACYDGVCPLQLERRLYQLLEARQKERIAELEFTLQCVQRNLCEKEMEISWWRGMARQIHNEGRKSF